MANPRQPEIDAAAFAQAAALQRAQAQDAERRQQLLQQAMSIAASKLPKTAAEAMGKSTKAAAQSVGATGANMLAYFTPEKTSTSLRDWATGKKGEAAENQRLAENYVGSDNPLENWATQVAIALPGNFIRYAPDVVNPVSKLSIPAGVIAKYPQIAGLVQKYGPDAVNMAYHSLRGTAESGLEGAVVNPTASAVGEKVIEPAVSKYIPRLRGSNIPGNIGGVAVEKLYELLRNMPELPVQTAPRQMTPLGY